MYEDILKEAEDLKAQLIRDRRDFHSHPELGWTEMRTSSLIARRLKDLGYDEVLTGREVCRDESRMAVPSMEVLEEAYRRAEQEGADPEFLRATRGGFTGVIGVLHGSDGPTVALRFDIDALPIYETPDPSHIPNQEGFRSLHDGIMHACGHDGHTAVGLAVAELLMRHRNELHGSVKLIFQPAEEGVMGARSIVEHGHLDGVDYALAEHMAGDPGTETSVIGTGVGRTLATTKMDVTFIGKASHAGVAPELGKNALLAAATAILELYAIPRTSAGSTRVNVGTLMAGNGRNVVCDRAAMKLEVRGATAEANEYMEVSARRVLEHAALMYDCGIEIAMAGAAKCGFNSPELTEEVARVCGEELGLSVIAIPDIASGSEDYSYMSEYVIKHGGESCYFYNITHCDAPFHNEKFDFNEEALINGVKAFTGMVMRLLS